MPVAPTAVETQALEPATVVDTEPALQPEIGLPAPVTPSTAVPVPAGPTPAGGFVAPASPMTPSPYADVPALSDDGSSASS
eukprot:12812222-Alexandrium_andersonii.AAC.1